MQKSHIIIVAVVLLSIIFGLFAWFQLTQVEDGDSSTPLLRDDELPRILTANEVLLERYGLPGRSPGMESSVVPEIATSTTETELDSDTSDMSEAAIPVSMPIAMPTEEVTVEESTPYDGQAAEAAPVSEPESTPAAEIQEDLTAAQDEPSATSSGQSGIEIIGVTVTDEDASGPEIDLLVEGIVMGTDFTGQVFTVAESESDESYRVRVNSSTEFYIDGKQMSFSDLMVGDIIEVRARGSVTSRDILADSVHVVAKLQLFDDGQ